jgi:ABC-type nitrate/sulfonate/bicarbonate transport system substrate-binding protein
LSGAVDAAVLTHPETIIARKQGFNELMFYGDHIEFVSAGVVATERNISQNPDFVRRFIRGALKTFYWIKANERKLSLDWPKRPSLPRVMGSNSTGRGSNFFHRTAAYREVSRRE